MRPIALSFAFCTGLAGLGGLALPADAQTTATAIASGQFVDADARHQGEGTATLALTDGGVVILQLSNFSVTPGPDLEVWLVDGVVPNTSADVLANEWLSLGPLQSPTGTQTYALPAGVIGEDYEAVVIWCEDFSVLFSVAALR